MNSYKPRSPFQPPSIPGYKRTQKSSPKMIQQPVSYTQNSQQQKNISSIAGSLQKKFAFQLKQPSVNDDTLYWQYQITSQVTNQYCRYLIFRQQQYFIRNVPQDGVVQTIYLVCDNVPGYINELGVITNRVCALKLSGTFAARDSAGLKYYDLLYRQTQDLAWKLPMDVSNLKFRIYSGSSALSGTLQTPLMTQFQIKHIGK